MLVRLREFIAGRKTLASFTTATIAYFLFTLFYMGGAVTSCSENLLNFPGDNTAGMIALFSADPHDPWYGYSDLFSYPYGESLGQPTHITAQAVFVPFWALAKLFGPICSFNLLQLFGFMTTALTMFGFVRWLLRGRSLVAFIAGYGVAFTPYLQITSGGHISYVFQAVFIAAVWLFIQFWRQPSWKWLLPLIAVVASFAYIDGYFILLGGLLVMGLVVGASGFDFWKAGWHVTEELKARLKLLSCGAAACILLLLPIIYVQITAANQINSLLAGTRDSIVREAQVYSARPIEYILPNARSPLTSGIFGTFEERDTHGSNTSESIISLSITLLVLASFFIIAALRAARRGHSLEIKGMRFSPAFTITVIGTVFLLALLFSFPPKWGSAPLPSYLLISVVQLWRVLARLSVIVNISLVILAACGLALFVERTASRWRHWTIYLIVLILIFLEYLTFVPPRHTSTYDDAPELYHWLRTQQQYKEIVEYPLDELGTSNYPVFYNTFQQVHEKKMLNGIVSEDMPYFARRAVRNLLSPQAVPGLRSLGIDFVTIHSPDDPGAIPGLRFVHQSKDYKIKTNGRPNYIWGFEVLPGSQASHLIATTEGFHAPIKEGAIEEVQVMGHRGILDTIRVGKSKKKISTVSILLIARSVSGHPQKVTIAQEGRELWSGTIEEQETEVRITAQSEKEIIITAVEPTTDSTLQLPLITVTEQ